MGPIFDNFSVIFAVVAALVVLGFIAVIVLAVRNARKVKRAGHDPLTLQADLATRVLDSDLLRPTQPTEQRLANLDALRAKKTITAEEHAAARAEIIRGA